MRVADSSAGTRTGSRLGTWIYAAPEVMENAKDAGIPADVYGLGMTAVFAVHGADLPSAVLRDAGFAARLDVAPAVRDVLVWIRKVLAQIKQAGQVTSEGRGRGARWRYVRNEGTDSE